MHISVQQKSTSSYSGESSSTAASNELPGYDCDGGSNDSSSSDGDSKQLTGSGRKCQMKVKRQLLMMTQIFHWMTLVPD